MDKKARFLSFLQQPSTFAELQAGQQVFGREEVQPFLSSLQLLQTREEKNAVLREFATLLPSLDGFHAGMLTLLCGILIERGGDVSLPINATLEVMVNQLIQVKKYVELNKEPSAEDLFQRSPDALRAQAALPFLVPAVMTMLCRDKETRKQWHQRQDLHVLLDELEEAEAIPFYLKAVFSLWDDQDLLVLDRANTRGFLVRLEGVRDVMYHCYALLQHALLEHAGPGYLDAEPTDPLAVRYAQNRDLTPDDYRQAADCRDFQRFNFRYPGGLIFFPGSASFTELPTLDGMPLLLVEKKLMDIGWNPANMYPVLHEALHSRVEIVRELAPEEVENWLQRLR